VLEVFLWNTDDDGHQLETPVRIFMDGIEHTVGAGESVLVTPGNSITLPPHIAHIFGPKAGSGGRKRTLCRLQSGSAAWSTQGAPMPDSARRRYRIQLCLRCCWCWIRSRFCPR
ncbi:MAG: D-lyxose/D-mannose family sugar isomerase, partial [Clostridia bacterium]|nr:D-lyxose/D-mannose family sugar isomerase [Clostridia bacterium]